MAKKKDSKKTMISVNKTVAENRRARFDYTLEDKFEAGIALVGTEVKSLRMGQCSLNESYIGPSRKGEILLHNATIPEYSQAGPKTQHEPTRTRKLLLHKREIDKLIGAVSREGYSIIPLRIFFNARGLAKVELALAKGKKAHDKREATKQRDWDKQKARVMREKG